jgi:predicted nucleic acid-binding protein
VNLFLDSSVILAALGRPAGASRTVFNFAPSFGWRLLTCQYVIEEVEANVPRLIPQASLDWPGLAARLTAVPEAWSHPWLTVYAPAKDRPVLFTAAADADVLLTLDRADFDQLLGTHFYQLAIRCPSDFLEAERVAGRIP